MGLGIVGDDQTDITPFQRQVFEAEKARRAEEKEKKMEQSRSGGSTPRKNGLSSSGGSGNGGSHSETVRYTNDGSESSDNAVEFID